MLDTVDHAERYYGSRVVSNKELDRASTHQKSNLPWDYRDVGHEVGTDGLSDVASLQTRNISALKYLLVDHEEVGTVHLFEMYVCATKTLLR